MRARLSKRPHLSALRHGQGGKLCCLLRNGGFQGLRGRAVKACMSLLGVFVPLAASGRVIIESAAQRAHRPPLTTPTTAGHTFSSAPARAGLCSPRTGVAGA